MKSIPKIELEKFYADDRSAEYEIRLRDLFSGKLNMIENRMNQFEGKVNSTGNIAAGVFGGIALEQAAMRAVNFIGDVSSSVVELGMQMEKTRVTFKTLLGGDQNFANSMIAKFQKFAQETPFNTNDVLMGAKKLTAAKVAMQDIIPVMSKLGDIASGSGNPFEYLTFLYQHTKGMGHLTGRLSNEFQLAGIDIASEIEKKLGINGDQYHKMISQKLITFKQVDAALTAMTSEGGQFFKLNDQLSQTVFGRWERFKDTLEIIGTRMGEQLLPMLAGWLDKAFDAVNKFQNVDLSPLLATVNSLQKAFEGIANLVDRMSESWIGKFYSLGVDIELTKWRYIGHAIELATISLEEYWEKARHPLDNLFEPSERLLEIRKRMKQSKEDFAFGEKALDANKDGMRTRPGLTPKETEFWASRSKFNNQGGLHGEGDESEGAGIEKISSGTRNITVNITKLIETVNFTKSYTESEANLKEQLTRALISEINNVNLAVQ